MPDQLTRVRVQSDNRAGVQVVARPSTAVEDGIRIASAPIQEIQSRIISPCNPSHAAAVLYGVAIWRPGFGTGLSWFRERIPVPLQFSCIRIEGIDVSVQIVEVSRNADNH